MPEEDGLSDKFDTAAYTEVVTEGNFIDNSGGLGYEFGQIFDPLTFTWSMWQYNKGTEDDWVYGDYDVFVGQYDAASDLYYEFTDSVTLEGASQLTALSLAAATALLSML